MHNKTLKNRIARRHKGLFYLLSTNLFLLLIATILFILLNGDTIFSNEADKSIVVFIEKFCFEIITLIISALISTTIAIYMTKDDILENDYSEKKDDFGILTFENGYSKVFDNKDCQEFLKVSNWEQFFQGANDQKIQIVGIHLNDFFENEKYRKCLLNLCLENKYNIEIILGNPYSDEAVRESQMEEPHNNEYIKNKIMNTYQLFVDDLNSLDRVFALKEKNQENEKKPSDKIRERFKLSFSSTLPKAMIFKVGSYMIVTPYIHQSINESPTLIVENSRDFSFYEKYTKYIEKLAQQSFTYELLPKRVSSNHFFTQHYRNLSVEFYDDLNACTSLKILGLGQNHMLTHIDPQLKNMLQKGGNLEIVLSNPDGVSTEMCVKRSILHNEVIEASIEHKIAINKLLKLKNALDREYDVKVYVWDCFFPYTMYAFNTEDINRVKIYIWITNLFEAAEKRLGFVIDGLNDFEIIKSFLHQYNEVIKHADEIINPFSL